MSESQNPNWHRLANGSVESLKDRQKFTALHKARLQAAESLKVARQIQQAHFVPVGTVAEGQPPESLDREEYLESERIYLKAYSEVLNYYYELENHLPEDHAESLYHGATLGAIALPDGSKLAVEGLQSLDKLNPPHRFAGDMESKSGMLGQRKAKTAYDLYAPVGVLKDAYRYLNIFAKANNLLESKKEVREDGDPF